MLQSLKVMLSYSAKSLSFIWHGSREYLFLTLLSIITSAIQVFPSMYLINYSIDLLTKQVTFKEYLLIVGIIILIMLSVSLASMLLNNRLGYIKTDSMPKSAWRSATFV